jgi:hypothetical protein
MFIPTHGANMRFVEDYSKHFLVVWDPKWSSQFAYVFFSEGYIVIMDVFARFCLVAGNIHEAL